MSEREEADQPQRYCQNCGTEIRPGNGFCVSCGANLVPEDDSFGQADSHSSGQTPSMNDVVKEKLQGVLQRFRGPPGSFTTNIQSTPQNLLRWFKGLPIVLKVAIVVVGLLLLLTVLSPLGLLAALLSFGVSLIGLIVRGAQRRSVKGWGLVAVASLVLAFAFGGISNALYGGGPPGSANSGEGGAASTGDTVGKGDATGKGGDKQTAKDGLTEGVEIDPKLQKIVDDWRSSGTESPLLLPTRLPFPIAEVDGGISGAKGDYFIWSEGRYRRPFANHIQINLYPAPFSSSALDLDSITIDGRSYPYTEDHSFISGGQKREPGQYDVMLWVRSERGKEYVYIIVLNTMAEPLPYEDFADMVLSLKRMDPPERANPPKKDESSQKK